MHTVKGHPILALTFSESQPCSGYSLGDLLILLSLSFTLFTEPLLPLVIRKQMSVLGDEPLGVTEVSSTAADISRSTDGMRDISYATWDPTAEFTCSDINHTSPLRISALGIGWHVSFTWLVTITLYSSRHFWRCSPFISDNIVFRSNLCTAHGTWWMSVHSNKEF